VTGSPSRPGRHRWREGRRGWGHLVEPGWIGGWCGSGGQATSCLGGQQTLTKLDTRVSLTLEDVEANTAQSVNVGVVDLGEEADFGRGHGVVVREEQLELEDAA
jgi:hypothetical protein